MRASRGVVYVLAGSAVFSCANATAAATVRTGVSELTLMIIRGLACYVMNGLGLLARRDRTFMPTMLLRTADNRGNCSRARVLSLLRGALNTFSLFCLLVALDGWLSLADAFAIFVAVATIGTTFGARALIGASEQLSHRALAGGLLTLCGALCITQPSFLFHSTAPPHPIGVMLILMAGALQAAVNLVTRLLGARQLVTPALLVTTEAAICAVLAGTIGILAVAIGPPMDMQLRLEAETGHGPRLFNGTSSVDAASRTLGRAASITRLTLPCTPSQWSLALLYCALVTTGQIALAAGFCMLPSAQAAILAVTELGFAYALSTIVMGEPTSILAGGGSGIVFVGAALVAAGVAKPSKRTSAGVNLGGNSTATEEDRGTVQLAPGDSASLAS